MPDLPGKRQNSDTFCLYIHIPYCLKKCPYCDFHSIETEKEGIPEEVYADSLTRQLAWEVERLHLKDRKLVSIYFGGGTPSLMSPEFFEKILVAVSMQLGLQSNGKGLKEIEITVETNPASATRKNFREWLDLGVNRVSFGVQSFHNLLLKKLGRNHDSREAKEAIQSALNAGFSNVSCDLIFGIEGQSLKELKTDLETVLSFDLPHLSAYQLTVEPNTPLAVWVNGGSFQIPEEEILEKMHRLVPEVLEKRGLSRYEISNYARHGFESRHNLQYWNYRDCLGIGSGAVSFINNRRWRTTKKLKDYLSFHWGEEDFEIIDSKTALKEKWMMGLRLAKGLSLKFDKEHWVPLLEKWRKSGAVAYRDERIHLTPFGFLWYNQIVRDVFEEIDRF